MIPRTIHRVWLGAGVMPDEFVAFGERWRELHPGWDMRTWSEADLDWIENRRAFDDAPSLSSKSNVARYEVLARFGGVYVDTDIEPLRPIDELVEGARLVVAEELPGYYGTAFIAAEPEHPVVRRAVADFAASHFSQPDAASPFRGGPVFWARCVRRATAAAGGDLGLRVLPRETIFPYADTQQHLRDAEFVGAHAVHHWAGSWVQAPPAAPDASSVERIARRGRRVLRRGVEAVRTRRDGLADRPSPQISYLGDGRVMFRADELSVITTSADPVALDAIVRDGSADRELADLVDTELRDGDVVLLVGTAVPDVAARAVRRVGETGRVVCVADSGTTARSIEQTIEANRAVGVVAELRTTEVADFVRSGGRVPGVADLATLPEISLVRIDAGTSTPAVLDALGGCFERGTVRMVDAHLSDRALGPGFDETISVLTALVDRSDAGVSVPDGDGGWRDVTWPWAVNQDELPHCLIDLRVAS